MDGKIQGRDKERGELRMKRKEQDQFSGKMFARLLAPSMVSALGLAVGDMADAIVIGQRMGATGLAAVSLALPVFMVINVLVHGLGIGGSVKYSKYLGEGKTEEAVDNFNQILMAGILVSTILAATGNLFLPQWMRLLGVTKTDGVLFEVSSEYVRTIVTGMPVLFISYLLNYYLRNDDNQKLASFGFTVANLSDVAMNFMFVLVLDMGAFGAALSTVLGQTIAILFYLPGIFSKHHTLKLRLCAIRFREQWECFRTGFATSVQYIWQFLFLLIINHTLLHYSGEAGVAVFDLIQNVSYLILYLYDGTVKAMQPLVSTYCGEHNEEGKQSIRRLGFFWGSLAGITAAVILCMVSSAMCRIFGLTQPEVISMGNRAIRIYCIGAVVGGLNVLLEGYYQSCEEEKPAFVMATLRGAAVLIPCTLLFAPLGMTWFWFLFPATELFSLLIFLFWNRKNSASDMKGSDRIFRKTIENRNEDLGWLLEEIEAFGEGWGANPKQLYYMTMTVEEICLLIFKKGFEEDTEGYIQITLIAMEDGSFELHIRDNAKIFNPFSVETEKVSKDGSYDMDAMGMLVIKQKAKEFFYRQYQGFNSLIVRI